MTRNVAGFCIGIGTGLVLGMLTAPRSGEDTRRLIQDETEEGMRSLRLRRLRMERWANRFKRDSAKKVAEQGQAIKAAITAGKDAYLRVAG